MKFHFQDVNHRGT